MKLEILPRISNLIWVKVFKAEEYIEQTTLIVVHSGLPNLIVAGICFILECPEAPLLSVESPPDLSCMVFSKAFLNICFGVFILVVASKSWSLESGDAIEKRSRKLIEVIFDLALCFFSQNWSYFVKAHFLSMTNISRIKKIFHKSQ